MVVCIMIPTRECMDQEHTFRYIASDQSLRGLLVPFVHLLFGWGNGVLGGGLH